MEQKTYTFEEAQNATLEYFGGDALAARVWANKYAMKDSAGKIYEQMGEKSKALKLYERIEKEYPASYQALDIAKHIEYVK